ncbi:DUF1799 domain-containing protein [Acidovorax sp. LjRoot117]|uniref:DUF1799 domain-containing protein n=1 Tax=Acidovorax sp. LjRoot117 TaxID=3342255 RepID=UPI003ECF3890
MPPTLQKDKPDDFDLWPEHQQAWDVYLGCGTQWRKRVVAMGLQQGLTVWEGLDYPGVEVVMKHYGVGQDRVAQVFAQLQVLEAETVAIRNSEAR